MRELYSTTLFVVPVAQPRQRIAIRKGKDGKAHVANYTPTSHPITDFKAQVRLMVSQSCKVPFEGPLTLSVRFYLARPQKLKTKKAPEEAIPHTSRPDLDNCIKGFKDSLKGLLWHDDAQVCIYDGCGKFYCEKDGQPRVEFTLWGE